MGHILLNFPWMRRLAAIGTSGQHANHMHRDVVRNAQGNQKHQSKTTMLIPEDVYFRPKNDIIWFAWASLSFPNLSQDPEANCISINNEELEGVFDKQEVWRWTHGVFHHRDYNHLAT